MSDLDDLSLYYLMSRYYDPFCGRFISPDDVRYYGGIALMLVGGATMAFGANEVIAAATGTNYIQQWTGMSDVAYGWTYFGLNLASFIGQTAGNTYNLMKTREPKLGHDGELNGYRYKTKNGKMFDFDYPHGNIRKNHFHGWGGPGLNNRTHNHWNYLRLIWWLFTGM